MGPTPTPIHRRSQSQSEELPPTDSLGEESQPTQSCSYDYERRGTQASQQTQPSSFELRGTQPTPRRGRGRGRGTGRGRGKGKGTLDYFLKRPSFMDGSDDEGDQNAIVPDQ